MSVGSAWFMLNLILALGILQLLSLWIGDGTIGRGLGFILHGLSG